MIFLSMLSYSNMLKNFWNPAIQSNSLLLRNNLLILIVPYLPWFF